MMDENKALHDPAKVPLSVIAVWMVLYSKATGAIIQVMMQSPLSSRLLVTDEVGVCEITDESLSVPEMLAYAGKNYVDTSAFFPRIRQRAPSPAKLVGDVLSNLPLPCDILISAPLGSVKQYQESTDTSLKLDFSFAGSYTVQVLSVKHLPAIFNVAV